jgi:hypothetical protein
MPIFVLKQYHRNPMMNVPAGELRSEWEIEAPDLNAAIALAEAHLLPDFLYPKEDFATILDENRRPIWRKTANAG